MWNWDRLMSFYKLLSLDPKDTHVANHARVMMGLIPQIRNHPDLESIQPGAAHAELYLAIPERSPVICVWAEESGEYKVSIMKGDFSRIDKVTIQHEDIVGILVNYVTKIQQSNIV